MKLDEVVQEWYKNAEQYQESMGNIETTATIENCLKWLKLKGLCIKKALFVICE